MAWLAYGANQLIVGEFGMKKWLSLCLVLCALILFSCNKAEDSKTAVANVDEPVGIERQAGSDSGASDTQSADVVNEADIVNEADAEEGAGKNEAIPPEQTVTADQNNPEPETDKEQMDQEKTADSNQENSVKPMDRSSETTDGLGVYLVEKTPVSGQQLVKADKHVRPKLKTSQQDKWLDAQVWIEGHQFAVPKIPYTDAGFLIEGDPEAEYKYMFTALFVTLPNKKQNVYDFYNHTFEYNKNDIYPFIKYAVIKDDMIYVALAHSTFTKDNPKTGFVMAIDFQGNVKWISEDQVCNSRNFIIVGNTIICGYGFTKESDYLNMLDLNTGEVVEKIPMVSAPEYLLLKDKLLYVLTYETVYEFALVNL